MLSEQKPSHGRDPGCGGGSTLRLQARAGGDDEGEGKT